MKRIEDIKEFEDIDTYYEISKIVDEVFQDRVEAHKHLVTANKEIERLNNIINRIKSIYSSLCFSAPENDYIFIEKLGEVLQELKGSDKE